MVPTSTGIQLIDTIQNKLLTSAELTGSWEKQLKEIEQGKYNAGTFIKNMKQMVDHLVYEVRMEKDRAQISAITDNKPTKTTKSKNKNTLSEQTCPKCKAGNLLKGKNAYGCSDYAKGCKFVLPFSFMGKKLTEKQVLQLLQKGKTNTIKGFKTDTGKADGSISFNEHFELQLIKTITTSKTSKEIENELLCPKCNKGKIVKGKTAYGCSNFATGCDFRFLFDDIRTKANGAELTKDLVYSIIKGEI